MSGKLGRADLGESSQGEGGHQQNFGPQLRLTPFSQSNFWMLRCSGFETPTTLVRGVDWEGEVGASKRQAGSREGVDRLEWKAQRETACERKNSRKKALGTGVAQIGFEGLVVGGRVGKGPRSSN